jgi:hypothetical protein
MDINIAILIVIAFAAGWWLGVQITTHLLGQSFRLLLKDLGVTNDQLYKIAREVGVDVPDVDASTADGTELDPLEITIEQHQGVLYAYRKDTQQFLGQGTDREGLIDSISKRMTNVRLIIDQEDGADLLRKRNG